MDMEIEKKPVTIEKIQKDLEYFDYELQMFLYHKLNGRDNEAESYLNAYKHEQKAIKNELVLKQTEEIIETIDDKKEKI